MTELNYILTPILKDSKQAWGLREFNCSRCGHKWRRRMRKLGDSWHAVKVGGGVKMEYPYRCPGCGTTKW